MSGEALNSTPSAESSGRTKIDDWVRGLHRTLPERTPAQLRQLQFHCGKPPPAAAPSTLMRMGVPGRRRGDHRALTYIVISKPKRRSQAVGVVHCMASLLK